MTCAGYLREKLERLNAEKRCWQLVKEILTFLAKVKRESEKSEKLEKFENSEKLEKLAFEKCEKFGFKKLRKLKVGERLAPVGNSPSRNNPYLRVNRRDVEHSPLTFESMDCGRTRNSPTGAVQQVSPLGVRDSKPRGNCRVAGEKRAQPFPFFSARESQPAKTRKREVKRKNEK